MSFRTRLLLVAGAVLAVACSGERAPSEVPRPVSTAAPAETVPVAGSSGDNRREPAEQPAPDQPPVEPAGQGAAAPSAPSGTAPEQDTAAGQDFVAEARMLYRVVACAGTEPVPEHLDARVVAAHCKRLAPRKERYHNRYVTGAKEFIAALRPAGLPDTVVYPFGGGDLISALVAFPEAREITTISLEHAGDPRRIRELGPDELKDSLGALSVEIGGMLSVSNNTSKNMSQAHENLLPAQLSSFLIGLAVHGYEPVSVRYFALEDDGRIRYLTRDDISALDEQRARQLKHDWAQPNFSPAFSHVELAFRRAGAGPDEPVRIHRHIAANLANGHLKKQPAVLLHLQQKGKVAAMTKAASYLLWRGDFSLIRDYLTGNAVWILSDSTGIPARVAQKAGMKQTTYGRFSGAFLEANPEHNQEMIDLWASQPYRRVPFRFGYVDAQKHAHLLITTAKP